MPNTSSRWLSGLIWLIGACASLPALSAAPAPATPVSLDNASCLSCHDGKKGKLEVPGKDGKPRALMAVVADKFSQGVHAKMTCVACHADIKDNAEKANTHVMDPGAKLAKVDCAGCHEQLWEDAKKAGTAKDKPRLELVAQRVV
jgi:hypothetical protein